MQRFSKQKNLQDDISDNMINIQNDAIIIEHIENITNIDLLLNWIEGESNKSNCYYFKRGFKLKTKRYLFYYNRDTSIF